MMRRPITILLFLFIISIPVFVLIFQRNGPTDSSPAFSLVKTHKASTLKSKISSLYIDVIGYKNVYQSYFERVAMPDYVLKSYIALKKDVFRQEPVPQKVVTGKDGWYFLGDSFSDVNPQSIGLMLPGEDELNTTKSNLLADHAWLASQHITGIVVVAPDKQTIYGQYLPFKKGPTSSLRELSHALSSSEFDFFIDLTNNISKHTDRKLYAKTDSHWNDLGAYYGAEGIIQTVQKFHPEVKLPPLQDYEETYVVDSHLDLAKMLSTPIDDENIKLTNKHPKAVRLPNRLKQEVIVGDGTNYENRFTCPVNNLKVVVFADSFGTKLIQYLSECFGESVFVYNNSKYDREIILSEKPDVVILETVERNSRGLDHLANQ